MEGIVQATYHNVTQEILTSMMPEHGKLTVNPRRPFSGRDALVIEPQSNFSGRLSAIEWHGVCPTQGDIFMCNCSRTLLELFDGEQRIR